MADDIRGRLAAAQRLVAERKYEEAGEAFLSLLPPKPTRVDSLDPGRRKAALHAGVCFARAGRARMAVGLFVAVGERERAAAVLKSAGRRGDADRVMQGQPAPDSPWPPGILHSRPHEKEVEGTTGSLQGDPFLLADRFGKTDRPQAALDALMSVEPTHKRYPEAVARAVRLAKQHGLASYGLEHFAEPFVRGDHTVLSAMHVPTLYSLGTLLEQQGVLHGAGRAFRAVVKLDPSYRDAGTRLAALLETKDAQDEEFARVLEADLQFAEADSDLRRLGSVPGRRKPVSSLPSLPELPPVKSLPGAPGQVVEPPRSRPGARVPSSQPGAETPDPFYRTSAPGSLPPTTIPPEPAAGVAETISAPDMASVPGGAVLPGDGAMPQGRTRSEELGLGPVQIGDVIAKRYRVDGELGAGGMAVVYRVTDLELEEEVALKLFARSPEDDRSVARFKQEMRIARRLSHPNIVRTFEFGTWRGASFLTMELLTGHDLDKLMEKKGGALPPALAMRLFGQALDGLGAAHALGVIHRDIKPANLFVSEDERTLKVMDFGIAKFADATSGHTATGSVVGTPAFIAPERLRGIDDNGVASDLYAMGVVMYQALTGALPFGGTDVAQLFMQILEKTPTKPSQLDPDLSSRIDEVIMTLIAKNPGERYGSCADARKAVDAAWEDMRRMSI